MVAQARRRGHSESCPLPSHFPHIYALTSYVVVQSDVYIWRSGVSCYAGRTCGGEEVDGACAGAEAENRGEEYSCRGAFCFDARLYDLSWIFDRGVWFGLYT